MLRQVKKQKVFKQKFTTGFTLVELLVTLSIFVIVTGIVLFNQNKFNSSIVLTNLSYDVALTIRQAQTFGTGGKIVGFEGIKPTYGVHLETGINNKIVVLFADRLKNNNNNTVNNYKFDGFSSGGICDQINSECLEKSLLTRGNYIYKICEYGTSVCYSKLDITFKRPKSEPVIKADDKDISTTGVVITLAALDGATRTVTVGPLGNINLSR
ncbi:MAG: prepilin-type N-terminal cleavage/methylation domain-containing protein [bacterium]